MGPREIIKGIYLVGSSDITDPKDCSVYLLDLGELVLIDAGAGMSVDTAACAHVRFDSMGLPQCGHWSVAMTSSTPEVADDFILLLPLLMLNHGVTKVPVHSKAAGGRQRGESLLARE